MTKPADIDARDIFPSVEAFLKSAEHLHEDVEQLDFPHKLMPIYYLYCHAIELALKTFLRAKGVKNLATDFGHNLQKLWDECIAKGLEFDRSKDAGERIKKLNKYAIENYAFRYVQLGEKCLPTLDKVQSTASDLFNAIRLVCYATVIRDADHRR